jgi:hypothetical protein
MIDREKIKKIREELRKDPERRRVYERNIAISKPMIDELVGIGYEIENLDDLKYAGKDWRSAIPILLRWLPLIDDLHTKQTIVRLLSVPWSGSDATAKLIEDFKMYAPILPRTPNLWIGKQMRTLTDEEKAKAPAQSLAWAIGNALSIVDVKGFEEQLIELCENQSYGMARQMIVWSLNRVCHPDAEEAAVDLLDDEDVRLHAIIALGKMKSRRALPKLQMLLVDKAAGISRESRKAIAKITRQPVTRRKRRKADPSG